VRILTANARVLLAVIENPDKTQREIGELLNMRYQHVWRSLDALVKLGILDKERVQRRTKFSIGKEFHKLEDIQRLMACIKSQDEL